jgi:glutathione S-transferase
MGQTTKLTLYHSLPNRSARVVELIEELKDLGVDLSDHIEIKKIEFDMDYLQSPEYLKINPCGTVPVLTDHQDITINESCGILLYILRMFGKGHLQPADDDAAGWAQFLNWMFRAETVLALPLDRWFFNSDMSPLPPELRKPDVAEAGLQQAIKGYQVLEDALKGKEYLVNNTYSVADIAVGYSAGYFANLQVPGAHKFPNIMAYTKRLMARAAAQRVWAGFQPPDMGDKSAPAAVASEGE